MTSSFNAAALCQTFAKSWSSGRLTVSSNGIRWDVEVVEGRLLWASHSVQSPETLEYHCLKQGYESAAQAIRTMPLANWEGLGGLTNADFPQGLLSMLTSLGINGFLNQDQSRQLLSVLSQDALEYLLWITDPSTKWQWIETQPEIPSFVTLEGLTLLSDHLDALAQRQQAWQRLWPIFTSPYQRPNCPDVSKLQQPIPGGVLSTDLLAMLVKLMQGANIRKLSLFLKQDDIKVAQLLYPYIEHQVLTLAPPEAPLTLLPPIPVNFERRRQLRQLDNASADSFTAVQSAPPPRYKVICIDDSPAMLDTIQRYLGTERFTVVTVENPMESLSALFAMKPDIILMDVSMPGINGNRLCQILRRSSVFKNLPIIMVSGNTGALDRAKAQSSGATDYLTKPFTREGLLHIINTHLSKEPGEKEAMSDKLVSQ